MTNLAELIARIELSLAHDVPNAQLILDLHELVDRGVTDLGDIIEAVNDGNMSLAHSLWMTRISPDIN